MCAVGDSIIVKAEFNRLRGASHGNTQADCTALRPRTVAAIRAEMPEEELLYGLSDFFKVMGDPTRINILWALEKESLCVSDLAVLLDMTKSAVSHQLKILRIAKLVRADKKGKNVYYALNDDHVRIIWEKALEHVRE